MRRSNVGQRVAPRRRGRRAGAAPSRTRMARAASSAPSTAASTGAASGARQSARRRPGARGWSAPAAGAAGRPASAPPSMSPSVARLLDRRRQRLRERVVQLDVGRRRLPQLQRHADLDAAARRAASAPARAARLEVGERRRQPQLQVEEAVVDRADRSRRSARRSSSRVSEAKPVMLLIMGRTRRARPRSTARPPRLVGRSSSSCSWCSRA